MYLCAGERERSNFNLWPFDHFCINFQGDDQEKGYKKLLGVSTILACYASNYLTELHQSHGVEYSKLIFFFSQCMETKLEGISALC